MAQRGFCLVYTWYYFDVNDEHWCHININDTIYPRMKMLYPGLTDSNMRIKNITSKSTLLIKYPWQWWRKDMMWHHPSGQSSMFAEKKYWDQMSETCAIDVIFSLVYFALKAAHLWRMECSNIIEHSFVETTAHVFTKTAEAGWRFGGSSLQWLRATLTRMNSRKQLTPVSLRSLACVRYLFLLVWGIKSATQFFGQANHLHINFAS